MWEEVQAKYAVVNLLVVVECLGKLNECFDMQIATRESTVGGFFFFLVVEATLDTLSTKDSDGIRSVVSA